jgi:hypothetical protein
MSKMSNLAILGKRVTEKRATATRKAVEKTGGDRWCSSGGHDSGRRREASWSGGAAERGRRPVTRSNSRECALRERQTLSDLTNQRTKGLLYAQPDDSAALRITEMSGALTPGIGSKSKQEPAASARIYGRFQWHPMGARMDRHRSVVGSVGVSMKKQIVAAAMTLTVIMGLVYWLSGRPMIRLRSGCFELLGVHEVLNLGGSNGLSVLRFYGINPLESRVELVGIGLNHPVGGPLSPTSVSSGAPSYFSTMGGEIYRISCDSRQIEFEPLGQSAHGWPYCVTEDFVFAETGFGRIRAVPRNKGAGKTIPISAHAYVAIEGCSGSEVLASIRRGPVGSDYSLEVWDTSNEHGQLLLELDANSIVSYANWAHRSFLVTDFVTQDGAKMLFSDGELVDFAGDWGESDSVFLTERYIGVSKAYSSDWRFLDPRTGEQVAETVSLPYLDALLPVGGETEDDPTTPFAFLRRQ